MSDCTVVIPTHNRPEHVRACLDSLEAQADPQAAFAVVVDDGSVYRIALPVRKLDTEVWPVAAPLQSPLRLLPPVPP